MLNVTHRHIFVSRKLGLGLGLGLGLARHELDVEAAASCSSSCLANPNPSPKPNTKCNSKSNSNPSCHRFVWRDMPFTLKMYDSPFAPARVTPCRTTKHMHKHYS